MEYFTTVWCAKEFIAVFQSLYNNSSCCVRRDTGHTDIFAIETGVRQGCIFSPFLFMVALDFVMRKAMARPNAGIDWDGQNRLTDLDFADDIALLAENGYHLQEITSSLHKAAAKIRLRISAERSKVMHTGAQADMPRITIDECNIKEVDKFTYLGSTIGWDWDAEIDVKCRIGKASTVFQQMCIIWSSTSISLNIKVHLYASIIFPMATYAAETWKASASISHKVDVFHQRCLWRILHIWYYNHITNEEVLRRSNMSSLSTMIAYCRLWLAGHIIRIESSHIPKQALQWVLPRGQRPWLTWHQTFINDLSSLNITWEEAKGLALYGNRWRALVTQYAS